MKRPLFPLTLGLTFGWLVLASPSLLAQQKSPTATPPQPPVAVPSSQRSVLHVNPQAGLDQNTGHTPSAALKTLTRALELAVEGTTIQLSPGQYTAESGEVFPLRLKPGVTLRGEPGNRGQGIVIRGGGSIVSPIFARQNVALVAANNAEIVGVTITNPNIRGSGIWVESTAPKIHHSTFTGNHREGIFVTGEGLPRIEDSLFQKNGGNGISVTKSSRGEIRRNTFQQTGFGLAIGGSSAPLVFDNQILENVDGIVITDMARPVLRGNRIERNRRDGVVAISRAQPDLGTAESPGKNVFAGNGNLDLYNATRDQILIAVGNQLNTARINGQVQQ